MHECEILNEKLEIIEEILRCSIASAPIVSINKLNDEAKRLEAMGAKSKRELIRGVTQVEAEANEFFNPITGRGKTTDFSSVTHEEFMLF